MKAWRIVPVVAIALSGIFMSAGVASASPVSNSPGATYDCTGASGGVIPPGTYGAVIVTGVCYMPYGNVDIVGNLTVAPGALLDAVTPGDPTTGTPAVPATVDVGGNVTVGQGAVLLLGCSPNISCSPPTFTFGISFDRVRGDLDASGAEAVVVHSVSIGGSVSIVGGGGGTGAETCGAVEPGVPDPPPPPPAPWSDDPNLSFIPVYTDFEDATVGGNFTVADLTSCWLGSLRNQIGGNATFTSNVMGDPDATELGNNLIDGNLSCSGDDPAPQFGDSMAAADMVSGSASGQCGFDVVVQNPPVEAVEGQGLSGVGIDEHLVVSTHSLGTYFGTHTATGVGPFPGYPITTESGDSIVGYLNSFTLTGNGLTGTATYTGGAPGQSPGEAFLGTTYPDGSTSFVAYDTCGACSFDGQTGPVTLRAYGTITPSGYTSGTFLITSSGALLPSAGSPAPGLSSLTGYGTFQGSGNVVQVTEHLGFA